MSDEIPEADWKTFRELRTVALERFCERVLAELVKLATDSPGSNHERYLAVYQLIKKRDKELAGAFDDFRRSTAVRQIAISRADCGPKRSWRGFRPRRERRRSF
jgi:hypothetical protein